MHSAYRYRATPRQMFMSEIRFYLKAYTPVVVRGIFEFIMAAGFFCAAFFLLPILCSMFHLSHLPLGG